MLAVPDNNAPCTIGVALPYGRRKVEYHDFFKTLEKFRWKKDERQLCIFFFKNMNYKLNAVGHKNQTILEVYSLCE